MDLLQNPFYILGATLRDNKRKIFELAEEKSLYSDSMLIAQAQANLTNPRKRLAAELAWLPGVGLRFASELINKLAGQRDDDQKQPKDLSPLAKVNFSVSQLSHGQFTNIPDWAVLGYHILDIAEAFENIDMRELTDSINADRIVSGFPEINDDSHIAEELHDRRRYIRQVIKESLNDLPSKELLELMLFIVARSTEDGNKHGFIIIDDLVDGYEIEVQEFIETEGNNIGSLIASVRDALAKKSKETYVEKLITQLITVVRNWQSVARPIQLNTKSRGGEHGKSYEIASSIRSLAIDLYNDYDQIEMSTNLIETIKSIFTDVTTIAERVNEDMATIGAIASKIKGREAEFARDITYETSVGKIFTDKLKISPKGIEWKEVTWTLDKITRIRWGGVKHSVNGIPTGTTYSVYFGSETNFTGIDLSKSQYDKFVDCLWKAVGVNILTNFLKGLQSGEKYVFGTTEIDDEGIVLEKHNFFSANEKKYFCWKEISIWNNSGCFCMGKEDTKFSASFSYLDHDNTHVLETAIRALWKNYSPKLSSLLRG